MFLLWGKSRNSTCHDWHSSSNSTSGSLSTFTPTLGTTFTTRIVSIHWVSSRLPRSWIFRPVGLCSKQVHESTDYWSVWEGSVPSAYPKPQQLSTVQAFNSANNSLNVWLTECIVNASAGHLLSLLEFHRFIAYCIKLVMWLQKIRQTCQWLCSSSQLVMIL